MANYATHIQHFSVQIPRKTVVETRILMFDFLFENINNIEDEQLKKSIPFSAIQKAVRDPQDRCRVMLCFKGNRPYVSY